MNHHQTPLQNRRGQASIILTLGMVTLGLGVMLVSNMYKNRSISRNAVQGTAKASEVSAKIMRLIQDDGAWARTVAAASENNTVLTPPRFSCVLTNPPSCIADQARSFILYDESGNKYYDAVSSTTRGFTLSGEVCIGYSASGNDACPLRADLTRQYTNCSAGRCDTVIVATFTYSPSPTSPNKVALNLAENFNFTLVREKRAGNELILLQERAAALGVDAGAAVAGWNDRIVNTIVTDTGANVTMLATPGQFQFKKGTYNCSISAPAMVHYTIMHQSRLYNITATQTEINGSASSDYTPSVASGEFTLAVDSTLKVQQYFSAAWGASSARGRAGGGVFGDAEIYTEVICEKLAEHW